MNSVKESPEPLPAPLRFSLEVLGSRPFYAPDKGGQPVYMGEEVQFAPLVLSQEEYLVLRAQKPYAVLVQLVRED